MRLRRRDQTPGVGAKVKQRKGMRVEERRGEVIRGQRVLALSSGVTGEDLSML